MSGRRSAWLVAGLTIGAIAWVVLLVTAPAWRAPMTIARGGDRAGSGPTQAVAGAVYLVASRVCHQRPERSFQVAGRPMPVCGRCAGLYVSAALAMLVAACVRVSGAAPRRDPGGLPQTLRGGCHTDSAGPALRAWPSTVDRRAGWLLLAGLPTIVTWTLEVAGLLDPGTSLRAVAALPLGAVAGWLLARLPHR